jgi:hypothetical protein
MRWELMIFGEPTMMPCVETNFEIFIPKTQIFLFRVSAFHKA